MMVDKQTIDRIFKWAEENRQKYEEKYFIEGMASALKTKEKYEDICDICRAAEIWMNERAIVREEFRKYHVRVLNSFLNEKKSQQKETYTAEEVMKWMELMRG